MDLEEKWQRTLEETKILHFYRFSLQQHEETELPYIFLGPSSVNEGDTVVRKGKVIVDRPLIVLPQDMAQFTGFDLEQELGSDEKSLRFFFLIRGIRFPSMKYKHEVSTVDIWSGEVDFAVDHYKDELEKQEDLVTGLIQGIPDFWQLSVLLYVCILMNRNSKSDMKKLWDEMKRRLSE